MLSSHTQSLGLAEVGFHTGVSGSAEAFGASAGPNAAERYKLKRTGSRGALQSFPAKRTVSCCGSHAQCRFDGARGGYLGQLNGYRKAVFR